MSRTTKSKERTKEKHGSLRLHALPLLLAGLVTMLYMIRIFADPLETNEILHSNPTSLLSWWSIIKVSSIVCILLWFVAFVYERKTQLRIITLVLGSLILSTYYFAFNPVIAPNGDNAEYIIVAKSIAEHGQAKRLDQPSETPNTLANTGLPRMLIPIYKFWGVDILKMKRLIALLALLVIGLLLALYRSWLEREDEALLLALVAASSPYFVSHASMIMTEIPYLFWSLLALISAHRFLKSERILWIWSLVFYVSGGMAYLTRSVGVSIFLAVICLVIWSLPWSLVFKDRRQEFWRSKTLKKAALLITPSMILFSWWQYEQGLVGISQWQVFFNQDILQLFQNNLFSFFQVGGKILIDETIFRWYRLGSIYQLPGHTIWSWLLLIFFLIGVVRGLTKRDLLAWYTVLTLLLILMGSVTPQERVMVRYLIVLVPMIIYYTWKGVKIFCSFLEMKWTGNSVKISNTLPALTLFVLFLINIMGNQYNVLVKSDIYNEYYQSFLKAATWCRDYLPDDALIMSIKPRLVYVLSDKKGVMAADERDLYSPAWAEDKLQAISDKGVSHIIVDAISVATQQGIYPLLENHPDQFEALPVPDLQNQCTVVRVK